MSQTKLNNTGVISRVGRSVAELAPYLAASHTTSGYIADKICYIYSTKITFFLSFQQKSLYYFFNFPCNLYPIDTNDVKD